MPGHRSGPDGLSRLTDLARRSLLPVDLLLFLASFGGAFGLRVGLGELSLAGWLALVVAAAIIALCLHVVEGGALRAEMAEARYAVDHLAALLAAFLIVVALAGMVQAGELGVTQSRGAVIAAFLTFAGLSLAVRAALARRLAAAARGEYVCLVGTAGSLRAAGELRRAIENGIACATLTLADSSGPDLRAQAVLEGLNERCRALIPLDPGELAERGLVGPLLAPRFERIPVLPAETFFAERFQRCWIGSIDHRWLLARGLAARRRRIMLNAKRSLDIALALLLGLPFLLLLPVIILAIRADTPGPALFRQQRIGRDGTPFTALKLRTMVEGAESLGERTAARDPRVTRIGRLLRASRLDEFPQLWNVLRGEMSMVGPRAESARLVEKYSREIACYHYRHLLRPGLTGLAQVRYAFGDAEEDVVRKLEFDLYYIAECSILLDLQILLRTIHVVLRGSGR